MASLRKFLGVEYDSVVQVRSIEHLLDEKNGFLQVGNHFRFKSGHFNKNGNNHHFMVSEVQVCQSSVSWSSPLLYYHPVKALATTLYTMELLV